MAEKVNSTEALVTNDNPAFRGYDCPNGTMAHRNGSWAFVPNILPPQVSYDPETVSLLTKATGLIGELNGIGNTIENPHLLIRLHMKREAVASSKIEGTLASIEDLNTYEALGSFLKSDSERLRMPEVVNYVDAIDWAWEQIRGKKQPCGLDIILGAHKILMTGIARGDRSPGKFRGIQNVIVGREPLRTWIVYVPPPPDSLTKLLQNLEDFCIGEHDDIPVLIQCAMAHYQFEAIHPFGDGNGRIGRLLILLLLCQRGVLTQPLLYMSSFFDQHKSLYYEHLLEVSRNSDWDSWLKFFLKAFVTQTTETIDGIRRLQDLRQQYQRILRGARANTNVFTVMDSLFKNPHVTVPVAQRLLNKSYATAKRSIRTLVDLGILTRSNARYQSRIYVAFDIYKALQSANGRD